MFLRTTGGKARGLTELRIDNCSTVEVLELPLWVGSAHALIDDLSAADSRIEVHSVNAEIAVQSRDDVELRRILKAGRYNLVDGVGIHWAARAKYGRSYLGQRIAGVDFAAQLVAYAEKSEISFAILGGHPIVAQTAVQRLRARHPSLKVEAIAPERGEIGAELRESPGTVLWEFLSEQRPAVLLVCLGAPIQEIWTSRNRDLLDASGVRITLSAGGTVDFFAGVRIRAPRAIQQLGLEWLYRLMQEPRRLGRQLARLPRFALLGTMDVVKYRMKMLANWRRGRRR